MKYLLIATIFLLPTLGFAQFPTGIKNFKDGDFEQAILDFTAAIKQDSRNWDAWYNRALCKELVGDHEGALEDLRSVLNVRPYDSEAILHVGINELGLGQTDQAIITLTRCIEKIPTIDQDYQIIPLASKAYYHRALAHIENDSIELAIKDLRRSVETDPPALVSLFKLANIKTDIGDYKGAIRNYDMYVNFQPYSAEVYNNRGLCKAALGNKLAAVRDFSNSLFVDSTNSQVYYNRGHEYFKLKEFEKAEADFSKALKYDENNKGALYYRAKLYGRVEAYTNEIQDLKKIIALDPTDEEAKDQLRLARINRLMAQNWLFVGLAIILIGITGYFVRRILKN